MTTATVSPVQQLPVRPALLAHSTLSRIDYADTFLADVGAVGERSAEAWARVVLEDAPRAVRARLVAGWSALGLKLALGGPNTVLGWAVRDRTPDAVLLGVDGRLGVRGELRFSREPEGLRFATFVQYDHRAARLAWAGVERVHVPFVQSLLERACGARG
jgi:hypothetical protein